jgi:hypothetical protein
VDDENGLTDGRAVTIRSVGCGFQMTWLSHRVALDVITIAVSMTWLDIIEYGPVCWMG